MSSVLTVGETGLEGARGWAVRCEKFESCDSGAVEEQREAFPQCAGHGQKSPGEPCPGCRPGPLTPQSRSCPRAQPRATHPSSLPGAERTEGLSSDPAPALGLRAPRAGVSTGRQPPFLSRAWVSWPEGTAGTEASAPRLLPSRKLCVTQETFLCDSVGIARTTPL